MVHPIDTNGLHLVRRCPAEPGFTHFADSAPRVTNVHASHVCFSRSTDNKKRHQTGVIPWWVCSALFFLGCGSDPGPAGSLNNSPDSGTPIEFGPIGLGCSDTAPCATSLTCLGATGYTLSNSVPAGGYCTHACSQDSDCEGQSVCSALDPNDLTKTYCAATCELGNDTACGNRSDVACWPRQLIDRIAEGRVCIPTATTTTNAPMVPCATAQRICARLLHRAEAIRLVHLATRTRTTHVPTERVLTLGERAAAFAAPIADAAHFPNAAAMMRKACAVG